MPKYLHICLQRIESKTTSYWLVPHQYQTCSHCFFFNFQFCAGYSVIHQLQQTLTYLRYARLLQHYLITLIYTQTELQSLFLKQLNIEIFQCIFVKTSYNENEIGKYSSTNIYIFNAIHVLRYTICTYRYQKSSFEGPSSISYHSNRYLRIIKCVS